MSASTCNSKASFELTELALGVPVGQKKNSSREESRLAETEEEPSEESANKVVGNAGQDGDSAPDGHAAREPERRTTRVLNDEV